jgi:hypothetical protein
MFPEAYIVKNNSELAVLGTPDLYVLKDSNSRAPWLAFEMKRSSDSERTLSQEYHILKLSKIGYARIVYPENYMQVLEELKEAHDI